MLKEEFEKLVGQEITLESFDVINYCYMQCDFLFPTKEAVASYYKKHDLNFFEQLKKEIESREESIQSYKDLLQRFNTSIDKLENTIFLLNDYMNEIKIQNKEQKRLFITYEEPFKDTIFNEKQMEEIYRIMVDKEEYAKFDIWLSDMLKSGVFEEFVSKAKS